MESSSTDIPKTENQISGAWIEKNTGLKPKENSIKVIGNIQAGVGCMSNLCRVSFQTEEGSTENILVKLLPENAEYRAISIDQKFDQLEIKFYSVVKPQLLEVSPELEDNLCNYYGGKYVETGDAGQYASVLIIEDLKPAGYQMLNPESEDWEVYLEKLMKLLANFHAAGFALEKKNNAKISELFPFCWGVDDSNPGKLLDFAISQAAQLDGFLMKFNCPDEIRRSYKGITSKMEPFFHMVLKKGAEFPVLIHGDVWSANIMVSNLDAPVKLIDWQLLGYRDASFELTLAIFCCMPMEAMEKANIEKYALLYYQEFLKICDSKGLAAPRSESEFLNFFNTWGIAYFFIMFLWALDSFSVDQHEKMYKTFVLLHDKFRLCEFISKVL